MNDYWCLLVIVKCSNMQHTKPVIQAWTSTVDNVRWTVGAVVKAVLGVSTLCTAVSRLRSWLCSPYRPASCACGPWGSVMMAQVVEFPLPTFFLWIEFPAPGLAVCWGMNQTITDLSLHLSALQLTNQPTNQAVNQLNNCWLLRNVNVSQKFNIEA